MGKKTTLGAKSRRSLREDETGSETAAVDLLTESVPFLSAADQLQEVFPPSHFLAVVEYTCLEWLCSSFSLEKKAGQNIWKG